MHWTLPPLLEMEVMSLFSFLETGKAEEDLRPVNGATMVAWAEAAPRFTEAMVADETMEKAIFSPLFLAMNYFTCFLILPWESSFLSSLFIASLSILCCICNTSFCSWSMMTKHLTCMPRGVLPLVCFFCIEMSWYLLIIRWVFLPTSISFLFTYFLIYLKLKYYKL